MGVGINDADYRVSYGPKGGKVWCPYYTTWAAMLMRCYSESLHKDRQTYKGCSVVKEWHRFSTFKAWMEAQDWEGKQLDKDLIFDGNKEYGPDRCIFVPREVNTFMTMADRNRGNLPIGLSRYRDKFRVDCGGSYLGIFPSIESASFAYFDAKSRQAYQLSMRQSNSEVARLLLLKYTGSNQEKRRDQLIAHFAKGKK